MKLPLRPLTAALMSCAALAAPTTATAGEWLAGDLHVHSTHSHDVFGLGEEDSAPEDIYTFGYTVPAMFALAATRGLDYLAITDHNNVLSQADPGFGSQGVIGLPAYENSLSGHAQMLGATRVYPKPADSKSAEDVEKHAEELRKDGGLFQINHPVDSTTPHPEDLDWDLGYSVVPDTVEAANGPRFYQPPFPASNSHDDAVRYWEGWLDRGEHATLTGGSDTHWVSTSAVQGAGQPTTWVYAEERSVKGILDGIRAGHTTVSYQPPAYRGAQVFLEADRNGDGTYEAMIGDTVPRSARLRARVVGGAGAQLHLVTDGGEDVAPLATVQGDPATVPFTLPAGSTWVRAELVGEDARTARQATCPPELLQSYCRNRLVVLAMSGAMYIAG